MGRDAPDFWLSYIGNALSGGDPSAFLDSWKKDLREQEKEAMMRRWYEEQMTDMAQRRRWKQHEIDAPIETLKRLKGRQEGAGGPGMAMGGVPREQPGIPKGMEPGMPAPVRSGPPTVEGFLQGLEISPDMNPFSAKALLDFAEKQGMTGKEKYEFENLNAAQRATDERAREQLGISARQAGASERQADAAEKQATAALLAAGRKEEGPTPADKFELEKAAKAFEAAMESVKLLMRTEDQVRALNNAMVTGDIELAQQMLEETKQWADPARVDQAMSNLAAAQERYSEALNPGSRGRVTITSEFRDKVRGILER